MRSPRSCPSCSWPRPWHGLLRPALLALLALNTVALLSGALATADQAEDWITINKDYSSILGTTGRAPTSTPIPSSR